jgi:hypothetical protein
VCVHACVRVRVHARVRVRARARVRMRVRVALGIQQAKRTRCIVLSSVVFPTLQFFFIFSDKR